MNEAETKAQLIDPRLKACGWGVVEGSKVLREYHITRGRIQSGGGRCGKMIADFILVHKGIKLAVVEAKSDELEVGEGVMQAKQYVGKLRLKTTYSTNGKAIYQICMKTGEEGLVADFLSPEELWDKTFPSMVSTSSTGSDISATKEEPVHLELVERWREKFAGIPFEDKSESWQPRYYQAIAVQRVTEAVAQNEREFYSRWPQVRERRLSLFK